MVLEMERETFREYVFRLLTNVGAVCAVCFIIVVRCIVQIGSWQITDLEREYGVTDEIPFQMERIPVKEQFARYIDALPVPERTQELEEIAQGETEVEVITQKVEIETAVIQQEALFDESDEMLLAQIMHLEEGVTRVYVSPEEARMAHLLCGSVILHRRNMQYNGAKSIKDVIYAPRQYESVSRLYTEPIPEETLQWARELLQNGPIGPEDMIFQSQFEQGGGTYAHIYNQYFCCLTDPNVEEATEGIENTEVVTETEETMALAETQVP